MVVFAASFLVFKESFSTVKLLAIIMILVGVGLLNLPTVTK
jgi:multidrug transporter EmrE-like cation transporter